MPVGEGGKGAHSVDSLLLTFLSSFGSIFYGTGCCSVCFRGENDYLSSFLGVHGKSVSIPIKIAQMQVSTKITPMNLI